MFGVALSDTATAVHSTKEEGQKGAGARGGEMDIMAGARTAFSPRAARNYEGVSCGENENPSVGAAIGLLSGDDNCPVIRSRDFRGY